MAEERLKEEKDQEEIKKETAAQEQSVQTDSDAKEETPQNEANAQESVSADENAQEAAEADETQETAKKGFFKKKDKKDKKDEQIEELTDRCRRTMAEFDNFRKRTEKEKAAMYEIGARDIIEKLLPVADSFERGLASIPEDQKQTPVADGMDKIYKQLVKMLEDAGVREIEAEGAEFDPDLHNAVMHVEDENLGENVVAEVLQKGYTYRDTVVRHSMVKVAN